MVPPANCFTVLVIDDMLANRVLLRKVLQGAGYVVVEAEDGANALTLVRDRGLLPDLVVTDIEMPGMDGIDLIREIRALDGAAATLPIVAASGNADETMRREAIAVGCDLFLTKPFDLASLRRDIGSMISARRRSPSRGQATGADVVTTRVVHPLRGLE